MPLHWIMRVCQHPRTHTPTHTHTYIHISHSTVLLTHWYVIKMLWGFDSYKMYIPAGMSVFTCVQVGCSVLCVCDMCYYLCVSPFVCVFSRECGKGADWTCESSRSDDGALPAKEGTRDLQQHGQVVTSTLSSRNEVVRYMKHSRALLIRKGTFD